MVLPLYLAMTAAEINAVPVLPPRWGCLAWRIPAALSPERMLILTDGAVREGQDPARLAASVAKLNCGSVLLDFEGAPTDHTRMVADALFQALPCPVAAPPGYVEDSDRAVFLPPCPLHVPMAEYLAPWRNRAVWLDVTRQRQTIRVTRQGTTYGSPAPADELTGGTFDDTLLCRYRMEQADDAVTFTLFDTPETLEQKMALAASLGVTGAVGLYQEFG